MPTKDRIWPRIASIAADVGVLPIGEDDWPLLGAYDDAGRFYDVEKVCSALRAKVIKMASDDVMPHG